ncbi:hypothetical protein GCM10020331_003030 [Ectobacillus funiculus]
MNVKKELDISTYWRSLSFFTLIGFIAMSLAQDDKPKIVVVVKTLNTEYWKNS